MKFVVPSKISQDFKKLVEDMKKHKLNLMELHYKDVRETEFKGIKVTSIFGNLRDYKYLLFLSEELGVDYLLFNVRKEDLRKLRRVEEEAKKHGVKIAIENNQDFRTPSDVYYALSDTDIGFVLNTSNARDYSRNIEGFIKMLRDRIVGIHLSDWYQGIGGLPYSLGESAFLDPVLKEFKKGSVVLDLDPRYSVEDVVISIDKLKQRIRKL